MNKQRFEIKLISKKVLLNDKKYIENDSSNIFYSLVEPGILFPISDYCFISTGWFEKIGSVFISDIDRFGTFYNFLLENNFKHDVKYFLNSFLNDSVVNKISFIGGPSDIKNSYNSGLAWESLKLPSSSSSSSSSSSMPFPPNDDFNYYYHHHQRGHFINMSEEDKNFVINICWSTALFSLYYYTYHKINKLIILNPFSCFKVNDNNNNNKSNIHSKFVFYDPFQTCLKDLEIFSSYNQKIRKEILIFLYILNQFEFFKRLLDTPFLETFLSATKGEREGEYREGVLETLEKAIENHLKNNRFLEEEEGEEELNFEIEDFVSEEFSILKKKYTFKNSCLEIKNLKNINRGARKLRRGLESNDGIFSPQNSRRRRLPQTLNNNNNNSQSIRLSSNKNYNKMALFKKFQNYESIYNVCRQNVALTNTKLFLQKELGNIFHYPSVDNRVCVNHSSSQFQDCRHCRVLLLGVGSIICLLDGGEKRCNTSTTTISGFFSEPSSSPPPPPSYEKSICVSDGRGKNNGNILFNKFIPSNKIHLVDETFCRIKNFKNDHKKGLSNLKEVKSNNNKANDNNTENDNNNNNNALLYRREKGGNFIILATRDTPASCFFVIEKINMETDNWGGKTARHLSSPEDQNNMFYSSQEALDELSASYNIEVSRYSVGDGGSGGGGFENSGMKRKTSDSAMKDDKKVIKIRYLFSPYFFLSSFHFSIKIYQMSDTIKLSFEEFNEKFKNEGIEIPREDQNYLLQNIPFQLFRTFMMKNQRSDNKIIRFKMPNDEYIHFNVEKLKEETGYYYYYHFKNNFIVPPPAPVVSPPQILNKLKKNSVFEFNTNRFKTLSVEKNVKNNLFYEIRAYVYDISCF